MNEILLRDRVELERQRDAEAKLNRIALVEQIVAVLKARFEDAMGRAVDSDDLKELKREVEADMNKICDHFDNQTARQSKDLLAQVDSMFQQQRLSNAEALNHQRAAIADDQKNLRRQIFFAVFTSGLGVVAALIVFRLTEHG